jgi:hypothetical protein
MEMEIEIEIERVCWESMCMLGVVERGRRRGEEKREVIGHGFGVGID